MNFTKILFSSLLLICCILFIQSCTTETKANEANLTNLNSATNIVDREKTNKNAVITNNTLKWYSIEEVEKLQAKNPKKVIVDIYTNWCRWCKVMDQKTFTDPTLIHYLNENYYMVKFNAESKTDIIFKGKKYNYVSNGQRGYNTLAAELVKGRLSYPSFVVLDESLNHLKVTHGFKNAPQFKQAIESINAI